MMLSRQVLGGMLLAITACVRPAAAPPVTGPMPVPAIIPNLARGESREGLEVQRVVDSLLALPQFSNMQWGVLAVGADKRDTLLNVQADRLFMPASNQKIVTGAVALMRLGPEFQWTTAVTRTGRIVRGELRGNLVVTGTGDPSVSSAMRGDPTMAFTPVIDALRAARITRIRGRVLAGTPTFPGSPLGFGWDWDDLDAPYGAGVSELLFNEGFADVIVRGCARAGQKVCVTTAPSTATPVIHNQAVIRRAGTVGPTLTWWRDSAATPGIAIQGSIAEGDSLRFSVAQPNPREAYLAALTATLRREGIRVDGDELSSNGVAEPLVVLRSFPLRSVLPVLEKPSQNQLAELFYRTLGATGTGVGTPDSARAVVERQLSAWGIRSDAHAIRDGSGLSRHNYISPRALVQILDTVRRSPHFSVFHDALAVAGVDGTLRTRGMGLPAGRVHAKTGTVDKVRALSGYMTTNDGEMLIFSIIANNHTVSNREIDRIQDLIVQQLAALKRPAP
jgi:serine-type D-Ala-D-Ala carboxypeptidase/endopeptidase (penicillin-binding protein 4)